MIRLAATTAFFLFAPLVALAAEPAASAAPAAATATATPDSGAPHGQRWAACATEVQKFCTGIEKGRGRMRSCLEGHAVELSDGCKARMAEKRGQGAI